MPVHRGDLLGRIGHRARAIITTVSPPVRTGYWKRVSRSKNDSPKGTSIFNGQVELDIPPVARP